MKVADSSALISFFLREPRWREVKEYLDFVVTIELSKKEIYNAIWKAHVLRGRLNRNHVDRALELVKDYFECCVILENQDPLLDKALELAILNKLTVYDSLFITVSLVRGLPLVTLDERQRKVAEKVGVKVLP